MGNGQSGEYENLKGYQVVYVLPNSPAEKAGLSPFFDFIIAVDEINLEDEEPGFFVKYIKKTVNQPVKMQVFSTKVGDARAVKLIPRNDWGGDGLLGCSIRYENVSKSVDLVWHVLDMEPGSPAERAGMEKLTDFIVGAQRNLFKDPEDFNRVLKDTFNNQQLLLLLLYSTRTETIREIVLTPALRSIHKSGSLGCDVGNGFIHHIPVQIRGEPFVPCKLLTQAEIIEEQQRQTREVQALLINQQQQQQQQQQPRPAVPQVQTATQVSPSKQQQPQPQSQPQQAASPTTPPDLAARPTLKPQPQPQPQLQMQTQPILQTTNVYRSFNSNYDDIDVEEEELAPAQAQKLSPTAVVSDFVNTTTATTATTSATPLPKAAPAVATTAAETTTSPIAANGRTTTTTTAAPSAKATFSALTTSLPVVDLLDDNSDLIDDNNNNNNDVSAVAAAVAAVTVGATADTATATAPITTTTTTATTTTNAVDVDDLSGVDSDNILEYIENRLQQYAEFEDTA